MNYKKAWKALEIFVSRVEAPESDSDTEPEMLVPEISDAPSARLAQSACCSNPFQRRDDGKSGACLIF